MVMYGGFGMLNIDSLGSVWQPKANRIRVGRDVNLFTATEFGGKPDRNTILGQGDDVALKSRGLFDFARSTAQSGGTVHDFRKLSKIMDESDGSGPAPQNTLEGVAGTVIRQKGDYVVAYGEGDAGTGKGLLVYKKDAETGEFAQVAAVSGDQDVRIAWDDDGAPQILKGDAALTGGVLAAQGEDEILFRASAADVVAGAGTTVFNASSAAGTYSGGDNVTYLGGYQGGEFTETGGKVTFAGYFNGASFTGLSGNSVFSGVFEGASIALKEGRGTFNGYFSASDIQAGDNGSTANGLFMNACAVRGGDGDDAFSGRFIGSVVDGGKGDDTFGNARSMRTSEQLTYHTPSRVHVYNGIAADFVNSSVNAGEGADTFKGVMWGGALNLNEGENTVLGVFGEAEVNGGNGDDDIKAVYSHKSSFSTGPGDDAVNLITADESSVTTGEGSSRVTLGQNDAGPGDATWQTRVGYFAKERPMETGELLRNAVNTEKGDNTIRIHNGESTATVLSGDTYEKQDADERTMRRAIGRYLSVSGAEPLMAGDAPAVTVRTGDGEERAFNGVERRNTFEQNEKPGMIRAIRRYEGGGSFSWNRWARLEG